MTVRPPRPTRTAPAAHRSHPSHGAAAPARPRRGQDHRRLLGAAPGRSTRTATLAHIERLDGARGLDRQLRRRRRGHACRQDRRGREFSDSEVYKLLEAMAWEIGRTGDADARRPVRARSSARVAAAQEPDGYLNTALRPPRPARRATRDLEWGHELYCYGHLFQAAVARARTRPAPTTACSTIARRAADHVCAAFGPDGIERVCGHPEIETALVELGRGDRRAALPRPGRAVRRAPRHRARSPTSSSAARTTRTTSRCGEATVLRGHAVRAIYLAAGAVDVAVETGDDELLDALSHASGRARSPAAPTSPAAWARTTRTRRSATTSCCPPDRAYSETCAGVGSVMFSLAAAAGHGRAAVRRPRSSAPCTTSSPRRPSARRHARSSTPTRCTSACPGTVPPTDVASPRASSSLRAPWFEVSCCPPNVARTLASLAGVPGDRRRRRPAAAPVRARPRSARRWPTAAASRSTSRRDYPRDGVVRVTRRGDRGPAVDADACGCPRGRDGATLGTPERRAAGARRRPSRCTRRFAAGDVVELRLPMAPRVSSAGPAHRRGPRLRRGRARAGGALRSSRSTSAAGRRVRVRLDLARRRARGRRAGAGRPSRTDAPADDAWPYGAAADAGRTSHAREVPLIAYHDWANRGPSTMRVWLPLA